MLHLPKTIIKRRFPRLLEYAHRTRYGSSFRTAVFSRAAQEGWWGSQESLSGPGSTMSDTSAIRDLLPDLLRTLAIDTLLDAPCGDHHWMRHVPLPDCRYIGVDIVPELIHQNIVNYSGTDRSFIVADIVADVLPKADLILCRDCLIHMPLRDASAAINNFKRTGAAYFLSTAYPDQQHNYDIATGDWHPVNLEAHPFNFPKPLDFIPEGRGRGLGLWRFSDIHAQ